MSIPFKRRPIQIPAVNFLVNNPRCGLFSDIGSGKTTDVFMAGEILKLAGEINSPTLIVAPARVARDTWTDEAAKWDQFKGLEIVPLVGTPAARKKLLRKDRPYFTVSYENAPWLVAQWMAKWPYKRVVADESDRLKGFRLSRGGQRAHSLGRIAHTLVDSWVNMTGTPSPNGLIDLWGQMWFLDRGERLGKTFGSFKERWFKEAFGKFAKPHPQPWAEQQIHDAIKDICLTLDPHDFYDLKKPILVTKTVKLPKHARKIYDDLEANMFAELENSEMLTALTAAALTNKCLQLANGAVYTNYPDWKEMHDEKIEALKEIQGESGGTPLLVSYAFKSDKARILKAIRGSVDISEKAGMAAFKSGDAPVGLAHPASMGHGIDGLQHVTNRLVRFGRDWNLGTQTQFAGRIGPMRQFQAGYDRPVWEYDIIAEKTVDLDCVEAHAMKRSVQDALLLACKRGR